MGGCYVAEIAGLPAEREPWTAVFLLSQDGWAGISNYHRVVYDESDEVALPDAQRSPAWKVRIAGTRLEIGAGYVRPLDDHFYIVRIRQSRARGRRLGCAAGSGQIRTSSAVPSSPRFFRDRGH